MFEKQASGIIIINLDVTFNTPNNNPAIYHYTRPNPTRHNNEVDDQKQANIYSYSVDCCSTLNIPMEESWTLDEFDLALIMRCSSPEPSSRRSTHSCNLYIVAQLA